MLEHIILYYSSSDPLCKWSQFQTWTRHDTQTNEWRGECLRLRTGGDIFRDECSRQRGKNNSWSFMCKLAEGKIAGVNDIERPVLKSIDLKSWLLFRLKSNQKMDWCEVLWNKTAWLRTSAGTDVLSSIGCRWVGLTERTLDKQGICVLRCLVKHWNPIKPDETGWRWRKTFEIWVPGHGQAAQTWNEHVRTFSMDLDSKSDQNDSKCLREQKT